MAYVGIAAKIKDVFACVARDAPAKTWHKSFDIFKANIGDQDFGIAFVAEFSRAELFIAKIREKSRDMVSKRIEIDEAIVRLLSHEKVINRVSLSGRQH